MSGSRNSEHKEEFLQKKRESQKIKRQQQLHIEEAEEPTFTQPRKKTPTERQDSLTRNIANVLGDSTVVGELLLRDSKYFLGTSRTEQAQTAPRQKDKESAKPAMHSSSRVFTGAGDQFHTSSYKAQSHGEGLSKSDHRDGDHRKHIPRSRHSRPMNRLENSKYSSSRSTVNHPSRTGRPTEQSSIHHMRHAPVKKDTPSISATVPNSDRGRISSTDSDMLETILKEMVNVPTHITDLPAGPSKLKSESMESSKISAPQDEEGSSDTCTSDSSDDETKNEDNPWSLTYFFGRCPNTSESRTTGGPKEKPGKRKLIDSSREHSPKIPNVQPREEKVYSPRHRRKPFSSRSSDSPASRHSASGESKVQNLRKTPSYSKTPPQENIYDNSKSIGRNASDTNKTSPLEIGGGHRHPSDCSDRMQTDSENSSSSSDSSTSESSEEESDSHDEEPIVAPGSNHRDREQRGDNTLYSAPAHTEKHIQESEMEKPVPSSKEELNPLRDKIPPAHHSRAPANITVKSETKSKSYPSLWVKIRSSVAGSAVTKDHKVPSSESSKLPFDHIIIQPSAMDRTDRMVSVGSETDQPIRRTNKVEVRDALPSDWGEISKFSDNNTVPDPRMNSDRKVRQDDLHSKQKQSAPVLPDSSVPGEQERIENSDFYLRAAIKLKHEGDNMSDGRTGKTRTGGVLARSLAYFEAALYFIMSGSVMENESVEERPESSSQQPLSPTTMYQQTLPLLGFVLKMRPRDEPIDIVFEQIAISCLRCQSFLYYRLFQLKRETAVKNCEILTKHFGSYGKSVHTHSPWRNGNVAPHVLSPMSPAVPSPFTHRRPSPASSNNSEQVSSSTQVGKMTPNSHNNLPQKTYDMYRQQHSIMSNLLHAHEKWDVSESLIKDHADFFRSMESLSAVKLTFHSSLRQVFLYYKVVLHKFRDVLTRSPSP